MSACLALGANVVIVGLVTRADLNGRSGTVHSRDVKRDRWNGTCCTAALMHPTHCPSDSFRLTQGACDVPQSW